MDIDYDQADFSRESLANSSSNLRIYAESSKGIASDPVNGDEFDKEEFGSDDSETPDDSEDD